MLLLPLTNLGLAASPPSAANVYAWAPDTGALRLQIVVSDKAQIDVASGSITLADALNFVLDTSTGTKIGTDAAQKLGFWGAAPVVQRSHILDADGTLADVTSKFNDLLNALESVGFLATS